MSEYEILRQSNIARNRALIADLGIKRVEPSSSKRKREERAQATPKRRKLGETLYVRPTRTSARIASAPARPTYIDKEEAVSKPRNVKAVKRTSAVHTADVEQKPSKADPDLDLPSLRASWSSWTPVAEPPTRPKSFGTFHFPSHPHFTPNKSPAEMLREGVFGGSYFRSLYSRNLATTISDDWRELPPEWTADLDVDKFLTQAEYDADVNKYGVKCGQSIEEWEASGWIDHQHDVRGWFQWYCRFFMGRRCEDDDRQVSRWARCVGDRGRWRRALLKKYRMLGIKEVADYGGDDEVEEGKEVSRVVSQTCLQWAYEVRQEDLDKYWRDGE